MYSVYDVGENYPIVENAYLVNDTLLYLKFSKTGLEVSNWNGTDITSKAYGFNLSNGLNYVDDASVTSTVLSNDLLKVYFNESIEGLSNLSICNAFSCYGKNVVRNSENNLPMEIVYNMSVTTSGEIVCGYQGKYWYSGACHSTAQSSIDTSISTSSGSGSGTYKPSKDSLRTGYSVNVISGQKVQISFDSQMKNVEVKSVSDEKIIVSVEENNYTFSSSSSVKIDLDSDGFYDLEINSNKIYSNGITSLEFKLINEEVPSVQEENQTENVINSGGSESEIVNKLSEYGYFVGGVLIIAVVSWILFKKKK